MDRSSENINVGLAAAISLIADLGAKSKKPKVLDEIELRGATLFAKPDGTIERVAHDPPARYHSVGDFASLGRLVGMYPNASVWHDERIVAILEDVDRGLRDDRVVMVLNPSQKYTRLTRNAEEPRSQAAFVRWIMLNLRDEFSDANAGLLDRIRAIKFRTSDEQGGSIQQGRESMGRSIEQEVAGAADMPDTVTLNVRRWEGLNCWIDIECALLIDLEARQLALKPLADELAEAEQYAQDWLQKQLQDACPHANVYYGDPN